MKILIAVASKHGSTREIAEEVGEELRSAGHVVDVLDVYETMPVAQYDTIVIGSALYAGHWMKEARQFVAHRQYDLAQRPVWLFSSGPLGEEDENPEAPPVELDEMIELTEARGHVIFDGRLDKNDLNLGEKLIVRMVKAPYGDFRDWTEIRSWAREVAVELAQLDAINA